MAGSLERVGKVLPNMVLQAADHLGRFAPSVARR
jgi:hypothetical protein